MNEFVFYVQLLPLSVSEIFRKNNVLFPRKLRLDVLRDVVESKVEEEIKKLKQKKSYSDETFSPKDVQRLTRLEQFSNFSEVQLENELELCHDTSLNKSYYNLLWKKLIKQLEETNKADLIEALNQLKSSDEIEQVSVIAYNREFNDFFVDMEEEIDGISVQKMRKYYPITSNRREVKRVSDKFKVLIPAITSKTFLQSKLLHVLKENNKLNDELIYKINNGTLKSLKLILKDLELSVQDLLTIPEIVEIIIENSNNKKIKVETVVKAVQPPQEPVANPQPLVPQKATEEPQALETTMYQQILSNQKLILQKLDVFNEAKQDEKKKKKVDIIFNVVVITLIIIVVIIWALYAITTLFV